MKNLSKSIVLLILYVFFYLNIERFNNDPVSIISIHPLSYLAALLACVAIILIPFCRRLSLLISLLIWNIVYLAAWLGTQPTFVGRSLQTVLIEMVLFSIAVVLAKRVAKNINSLELLIQYVILPNNNQRVMDMDAAEPVIEDELIRSRRYDYPVSTLVLKPDPIAKNFPAPADLERISNEIQDFLKVRYTVTKMAEVIGSQTRRTDLIIRQDNDNRFIVICPEINLQNAALLADRLRNISQEKMGVPLTFGVATFPQDGPTFQAVLDEAVNKLNQKDTPSD